MYLATSERFADQIPEDILEYEGAKYFANILLLYAPLVTKLLARIGELGIPIDIIAPDHGPIWREDSEKILAFYGIWAEQTPTRKAVVVYDTMWNSTATMARAIADGIIEGGASVKLMPMRASHRDEVPPELLDAGALLVGSPTINNNMFPTVADLLTYLKGLKPKNLIGAAFGSYGWSGEAVGQVGEVLRAMKLDLVVDGLKIKYVPDSAALEQCHEFGADIARKLTEKCGE
jgi:flavorubredoxin